MNAVARLLKLNPATEVWFDSSPLLLDAWKWGAELEPLFGGVTTNPPLSLQVLKDQPGRYEARIREIKQLPLDAREKFFRLYLGIVQEGAARFPKHYLSGQVDNRDYNDADAMLATALRLRDLAPNIMVKMPATPAGIEGIEHLTALGISTNATLTFSLSQLTAVAEAVKRGLKSARENKADLSRFRSVVTFMLGRTEDAEVFKGGNLSEEEKRWLGLSAFKKAYGLFKSRGYESKLLAASMRKGPGPKIWHLEKLAGADAVLTVFPNILEAFAEGYADAELTSAIDEPAPQAVMDKLLKLKPFRQVYEEDGLRPDEWTSFGPVKECAAAFNQAAEDMQKLVS